MGRDVKENDYSDVGDMIENPDNETRNDTADPAHADGIGEMDMSGQSIEKTDKNSGEKAEHSAMPPPLDTPKKSGLSLEVEDAPTPDKGDGKEDKKDAAPAESKEDSDKNPDKDSAQDSAPEEDVKPNTITHLPPDAHDMELRPHDSVAPEPEDNMSMNPDQPLPDSQSLVPEKGRDVAAMERKNRELSRTDESLPAIISEPQKHVRMGEKLIEKGIITEDQLEVALHEQKSSGGMLGEILVELGFVTTETLMGFISEKTGHETFDPKMMVADPDALELLAKNEAMRIQVLPVSLIGNVVKIAMADPYDVVALDRLRSLIPRDITIEPLICPPAELSDLIDRTYGYASSVQDIMNELAGKDIDLQGIEDLSEDNAYSHPIVRLVNALVMDSVKMGASDIHFEPEEGFVRMRNRIDGTLKTIQTIHKDYWPAMSQRLKIISGLNIADKLLPQDGRFYLSVGGREADFRVSSLPTVNGENFVLRILDKQSGIMPMEALGFSDHNMNLIKKSQSRPEGIIIVTGPTGSGKTTSLYSMLNAVNTPDVNIMTLEDPVEYSLPMIRQTHVKSGAGLTFADGVKALLRQDPDIIFVGEVRDHVTAEQALKAAMTGHQVYTSLHTNDCFGAIPRLLDLGLQPGMLAGAIVSSFAQRLVRRLCDDCKEMYPATEEECRLLEFDPKDPPVIGHAKGCDKCENTGYRGRTAVVEILFMNDALNEVIADGGNVPELRRVAVEHGFKSMLDDGVDKILKGMTSLEALMKSVDFSDRL